MKELTQAIIAGTLILTTSGALVYAVKTGIDLYRGFNPAMRRQCDEEYFEYLRDSEESK